MAPVALLTVTLKYYIRNVHSHYSGFVSLCYVPGGCPSTGWGLQGQMGVPWTTTNLFKNNNRFYSGDNVRLSSLFTLYLEASLASPFIAPSSWLCHRRARLLFPGCLPCKGIHPHGRRCLLSPDQLSRLFWKMAQSRPSLHQPSQNIPLILPWVLPGQTIHEEHPPPPKVSVQSPGYFFSTTGFVASEH